MTKFAGREKYARYLVVGSEVLLNFASVSQRTQIFGIEWVAVLLILPRRYPLRVADQHPGQLWATVIVTPRRLSLTLP